MLSTSAFNALLKTLEEPPPHVVFIFATTEAHKIPTTILSRCQRYDFKLIPTARLTAHLEQILVAEKIASRPTGCCCWRVRRPGRFATDCHCSIRSSLMWATAMARVLTPPETITREIVSEVLGVADRTLLLTLARAVLARDAGHGPADLRGARNGGWTWVR